MRNTVGIYQSPDSSTRNLFLRTLHHRTAALQLTLNHPPPRTLLITWNFEIQSQFVSIYARILCTVMSSRVNTFSKVLLKVYFFYLCHTFYINYNVLRIFKIIWYLIYNLFSAYTNCKSSFSNYNEDKLNI